MLIRQICLLMLGRIYSSADHNIKSIIAVAGERISLGLILPQPLFSNYTDAWFFPEQRRVLKPGPLRDVSIEDSFASNYSSTAETHA